MVACCELVMYLPDGAIASSTVPRWKLLICLVIPGLNHVPDVIVAMMTGKRVRMIAAQILFPASHCAQTCCGFATTHVLLRSLVYLQSWRKNHREALKLVQSSELGYWKGNKLDCCKSATHVCVMPCFFYSVRLLPQLMKE